MLELITEYLDHLEEAFLFFSVAKFSFKMKEQLSSNKKPYSIDNGFVTARAVKTSPDIGHPYENVAAIELKRRGLQSGRKVFFWKNPQQEEVDFVVREGHFTKELIQVCASFDRKTTRDRELRSLLKASKELRCNRLTVLTGNYTATEKVEWFEIKREVNFVPLWRWLLD